MNYVEVILFMLTFNTSMYLLIMILAYFSGSGRIEDYDTKPKRGEKVKSALIIPMIAENDEYIESCLESIANCYKPDDDIDIIVVSGNLSEEQTKKIMKYEVEIFEVEGPYKNTKSYLLDCVFARYNDYDFYIIVDSYTVVKKGLIVDMIYAYQAGYDVIQGSVFMKKKDNYKNAITNLYLLVVQGFIPKAKSNLGLSAGIFGNNMGISGDVLRQIVYSSSSVIEDNKYNAKLINGGYKVKFIEELKSYSEYDYKDSAVLMLKRICGSFYIDFEYISIIIKGLFGNNKREYVVLFFEAGSIPNCYYLLASIVLLFSEHFLYYGLYSIFLIFFVVLAGIYRFGDDRDLLGILYLPNYLLLSFFGLLKHFILLPFRFFILIGNMK